MSSRFSPVDDFLKVKSYELVGLKVESIMDKSEADAIGRTVKKLVKDLSLDAHYLKKYGGEVIAPKPDDDSFVGGIFEYKEHVSLEFSQGASFDDPEGHLEGEGKERRHLKFQSVEDVEDKNANAFLRQALSS